ncbi:hypothetical protein REPUB_Repub14bG0140400 [Reevesia pubescens]
MATESSRSILLFLVFLFSGLTYFVTLTVATAVDPSYLHSCASEKGKYTGNSTYEGDLNRIFNQITSGTNFNIYGFYSNNIGEVSAIAVCKVNLDDCISCLNDIVSRIKKDCPWYKEATGWSEFCMLRYSNSSIITEPQQQPTYRGHSCPNTTTFTINSTYQANRNSVLSSLMTYGTPGNGFYNTTSGRSPDKVYGIYLCRGDVSFSVCQGCVTFAANEISQRCPVEKVAVVWYDECLLRYSDGNIFSVVTEGPLVSFYNKQNVTEQDRFNQLVMDTMYDIATQAAYEPSAELRICCFLEVKKQNRSNRIPTLAVSLSAALGLTMVSACGFFIWRRRNIQDDRENSQEVQLLNLVGGRIGNEHSSKIFSGENEARSQAFPSIQFDILHTATNHFSEENKLGEGGFGPVYKGTLADGKEIAVKRLSKTSGQGLLEFKNEVMLIARLQHKNLVKLIGCCLQKNEKLLVYEFMPNRSLDVFLFDSSLAVQLAWQKRFSIIKGIARGIMYLHEDSRLKIIHRDLKASNVLLDQEMNPKISDFGMARIFSGDQNEANTNRVVGTYGYMAPEYAMEGLYSIKSDVFSFGVLLLEIITGKRNAGFNKPNRVSSLVAYAWKLWSKGQGMNLMDQLLLESCVDTEVLKCIHIGLLCVQEDPADRPTMSTVVVMLATDTITLPLPAEPAFSVGRVIAEPTQPASDDRVCSVNEVTISNLSPR